MIDRPYTIRIASVTALLADTKAILAMWDLDLDVEGNLERIRRTNVFGGASRIRAQDILRVLRLRYFVDPDIGKALAILVQGKVPGQWVDPLLYYYSAQNDATLHDLVLGVIWTRQQRGYHDVSVEHIMPQLREWVAGGKTAATWNDRTILNVAQHALAALRDFGMLQGRITKSFKPIYLPLEAFTLVAFDLWRGLRSGERVLHSTEWGLFFLLPSAVERLFLEAHQERLLSYNAAGSVIRLEFFADSLMEVAHALVKRGATQEAYPTAGN